MNTRGGKKAEEPDDGGAILSGSATSCGGPNNEVEELTALVKSLILDQSARDKRLEKEMCLQEQRWKAMQQQFQQIQQQQGQQSEHSELNVRRRTIGIQPSRDYEEDFEDDGPDPGSDGYRPRREPKLPGPKRKGFARRAAFLGGRFGGSAREEQEDKSPEKTREVCGLP
uniref:Uncharacterized protein n=1 Tax=Knipowitschia caucasica TaxID=637954 RepID=A0AAV2LAK4_KNICA